MVQVENEWASVTVLRSSLRGLFNNVNGGIELMDAFALENLLGVNKLLSSRI